MFVQLPNSDTLVEAAYVISISLEKVRDYSEIYVTMIDGSVFIIKVDYTTGGTLQNVVQLINKGKK
jgi:hypothetical protein